MAEHRKFGKFLIFFAPWLLPTRLMQRPVVKNMLKAVEPRMVLGPRSPAAKKPVFEKSYCFLKGSKMTES